MILKLMAVMALLFMVVGLVMFASIAWKFIRDDLELF